ncbi:transforming growth factor-beta-induced protein ig-h3-like protein, partial [Sarcoptes scabiei]
KPPQQPEDEEEPENDESPYPQQPPKSNPKKPKTPSNQMPPQQPENDHEPNDYDDDSSPFEQQKIPFLPKFEPSTSVKLNSSTHPNQLKRLIESSAQQMNCHRFALWIINSGELDRLLKNGQQCTVFIPIDSAASQLPFNMLSTLNQNPSKMANLMRLHVVPSPFPSIYHPYQPPMMPQQQNFHNSLPVPPTSNHIRFDRSLIPIPGSQQFAPLVSGCPMLDSHQIGPVRLVSIGSVMFPPQPSIYSVLKRSPNLRMCRDIVDVAQMGPQLDSNLKSYTMFSPSDSALRKRFSPRQMNSLLKDQQACRQLVDSFLVPKQVVYRASIPLTSQEQSDPTFQGRQAELMNCNNQSVRFRRTAQSVYVNDAHVQYSDITTMNGVLHILGE